MEHTDKNILVAYFSHKGQNYSNGKIIDLEKGNTAVAAELIATYTNADLYEIEPIQDYPYDYKECVKTAVEELKQNARPELLSPIDLSGYDTVFIGYPNWCGTMPMPVWTFLEQHDFSGKNVLPFCTNEGSGLAKSESDIKKLIPNAILKKGISIHGSSVGFAQNDITEWINQNR